MKVQAKGKIRVEMNLNGTGRVFIDEKEISQYVSGIDIRCRPGEALGLTLRCIPGEVCIVQDGGFATIVEEKLPELPA